MGFAVDEFPFSSEYDSDLRAVLKYMREFQKKLDGYDVVIADLKRELENIQGLYTRVDALEQATSDLDTIRSNIAGLTSGLEALVNKEKADVDVLQSEIDNIIKAMDSFNKAIQDVYSYVNNQFAKRDLDLNKKINVILRTISDLAVSIGNELDYILYRLDRIDTSVVNPWHSELGRIEQDENAKLIYLDLADNELTAEEYVKLGLTADSYIDLDITAYEYARRGKQVTHFYWVYNPVKGWRQEISNVLTALCNYCKDTLTATEYADLQMSADAYASLRLTAKDYYEFNPAHVGLYEKDGTLQSRQFDLIEENGVLIIQRGTSTETDGVLSVEA